MDNVVITVAPQFIGDGIGFVPHVSWTCEGDLMSKEDEKDLPGLETIRTETMGKDAVMVCKVISRR